MLDYVQHNISFNEVCSCYDESDIKEYVSDRYIPSDIWSDIDVLQDYSWFELMDYGKKDMYGQNMIDFLNESKEEIEQEQKLWEWGDKWIRRQRG